MNTTAAAMMLLMVPAGVVAEPRVLSSFELNAITAAGIAADVTSEAAARGSATRTLTDANTFAVAGERFHLGVGRTVGHALACCGEDVDVAVGSTVLGAGDIVRSGTRVIKNGTRLLVYGLSAGFVVAVSFDDRLAAHHGMRP